LEKELILGLAFQRFGSISNYFFAVYLNGMRRPSGKGCWGDSQNGLKGESQTQTLSKEPKRARNAWRFLNLIDIIAKSMRVNREDLITYMESMRDRSTGENMLQPGIYLACFAIRATVKQCSQ